MMAEKFKQALREKGPSAVGMFGSGQWTIWEGYAASKLMSAGFRSNNLDPNARHCMASAAVTFIRAFGIDEPMGCYDDMEHADAFVLWGSNMAEMHPILWTRVTDRRLSAAHVKVARAVDVREPQLRARRHQHRLPARQPTLRSSTRSPTTSSSRGRSIAGSCGAHELPAREHRHRLRAPAGARSRAAGGARERRRRLAPVELRGIRKAGRRVHVREGRRDIRRSCRTDRGARPPLCRSRRRR